MLKPLLSFLSSFLILSIAVSFFSEASRAFSIADHKRITQQAVSELNHCYPGTLGLLDNLQLWSSDVEEDLNVIRKDLMFSHFYNPYKKLDMWRFDSGDRVRGLTASLKVDALIFGTHSKDALIDMGYLIHHLQDMASPPHVVPLMHGLGDGFENHVPVIPDISSELSCEQIKQLGFVTDYVQLLNETAKETLARVDETPIPLSIHYNGKIYHPKANVSAFWQAGEGNSFGQYGVLGNHYGESTFVQDGVNYEIPESFYISYKQAQLRLAVQSTLRALSAQFLNQ